MANLLPQDNFDTFLSVPLNSSDTTAYVDTLPTKTSGYLVIFEQDGRTFREKIKYTGIASSPNRITGLTRGLSATDTAGAYPDTAGTGLDHPSQVRIAMTDNVNYLGRALAQLNGTEELGGVPQMPATRTIDSSRDIVDKEYADAVGAAAGGITAFQVTQNGADPSLTINVGAGTFISGATQTAYAGAAAQAVTANQTNYVQLSKAGVLDINIVGFTDGYLPLATVVAGAADISSITDKRAWLTMALTPDQVAALAGTSGTPSTSNKFVTNADTSTTYGAGRIPRAAPDGYIDDFVSATTNEDIISGEAVDGSVTPQVVCIKASDGKYYKAKANDSTLVNAYGFVYTNAGNPAAPKIKTAGILGGFTGLTKGAMYYVTDTAGSISTTPSTTCQIPVGRAISATQIQINFGKKVAFVNDAHSITSGVDGNNDVTITCGFRPSRIDVSLKICSAQSATKSYVSGVATYLGTSILKRYTIGANINGSTSIPSGATAITTTTYFDVSVASSTISSPDITPSAGNDRATNDWSIASISDTGLVSRIFFNFTANGGAGSVTTDSVIHFTLYE